MVYNYLSLKLTPFTNQDEVPANADSVELLVSKEQFEKSNFQKSLKDAVGQAFTNKENNIINTLGEKRNFIAILPNRELESLRLAGASLYASFQKEKSTELSICGLKELTEEERYALLEGLLLSSYDFTKYKKNNKQELITVYISSKNFSENQLAELNTVAEAVSLTKTLVNEPVNYMDALKYSEVAMEMGKTFGFEVEILHKDKIQALKMGGLLAVNKGSETPPTFNVFEYKPANAVNKKPLVFVGKGVMFDTGGYSIKVGGNMSSMKSDMAGGAATLGILSAISANKLPYHVIGLVPATDNKISANALVVDDVITMMDGTTVEVQNTDAEGRLVLADALTYAKRYDPELVIDMATLTGAAAAITGPFGIAMAGNDEAQMNELKTAGDAVYERLFQLPFWKEFSELLKSDIADLKNIGGPVGGATTAGKFLEHFTDYPWIHLDIAGAAFAEKPEGYKQSGATAVAVRLMYDFIKNKCK